MLSEIRISDRKICVEFSREVRNERTVDVVIVTYKDGLYYLDTLDGVTVFAATSIDVVSDAALIINSHAHEFEICELVKMGTILFW